MENAAIVTWELDRSITAIAHLDAEVDVWRSGKNVMAMYTGSAEPGAVRSAVEDVASTDVQLTVTHVEGRSEVAR